MENKKLFLILGIVAIVILIGGGLFFIFQWQKSNGTNTNQPPATSAVNTNKPANLPTLNNVNSADQTNSDQEKLAKEKYFVSTYYKLTKTEYTPKISAYPLPLTNIKEQALNYRDFDRKLGLVDVLPKLVANGFGVIGSLPDVKANDWQNSYAAIHQKNLPIFITSDSLIGVYQDGLGIIYKEIEQENFYNSLRTFLKDLFDNNKKRFEARQQRFGIENDLITEANRLELSYLAVGLKLLQPKPEQIKEIIGTEGKFFSTQEAATYDFSVPAYLEKEVTAELNLIKNHPTKAQSPIFLYEKSYGIYKTPEPYASSEKLKNYYLATVWLNDSLFPLWNKSNDCPNCLLDEDDHTINFAAAAYLTSDIANNQNLKNSWANIYKTISFFQGLEVNLTYLNYQSALQEIFGQDYSLAEIFGSDPQTTKTNIKKLQAKINTYEFLPILGGDKDPKEIAGWRLLRRPYVLENKIFEQLTAEQTGIYLEKPGQKSPFTLCRRQDIYYRCWPMGLDILNVLENPTAKTILAETKNDFYQNYQSHLANLITEVKQFDQNTWHDNYYLSLLSLLKNLNSPKTNGYPVFMQNDRWKKLSINTSLAGWVNFFRPLIIEKTATPPQAASLTSTFTYGYVEPQIELYDEILADIKMIKNGFKDLGLIAETSKSWDRLNTLQNIFERASQISFKELNNDEVTIDDYNFINNIGRKIWEVSGDVKNENLQNIYVKQYSFGPENPLKEYLDGLDYLIVVYPDKNGKLFLAIGPTWSYFESQNNKKIKADWQNF